MVDRLTPERRSVNMSLIRSGNTKPEMIVRRLVHGMGHRYRLHRRDLPGRPDLVFGPKKKAIFVHGCFWHQHDLEKCLDGRRPKSNTGYWNAKLDRNKERDAAAIAQLEALGWKVMVVWECETEDLDKLGRRVHSFLDRR